MSSEIKVEEDIAYDSFEITSKVILETEVVKEEIDDEYEESVKSLQKKPESEVVHIVKMSRSSAPNPVQIEKLADLVKKYKVANGHARTAYARDRTNAAWQKIAADLNSISNGCRKTAPQWSKYWKDKKSALKRKVSQRFQSRPHTDGVTSEDDVYLTALEERLLAVVSGESFAVGDKEPEVSPEGATKEPEIIPPRSDTSSPGFQLNVQNHETVPEDQQSSSDNLLQDPLSPAETAESIVVLENPPVLDRLPQPVQPANVQEIAFVIVAKRRQDDDYYSINSRFKENPRWLF